MTDNNQNSPTDELEEFRQRRDRIFNARNRPHSLLARGSRPVRETFQDEDGQWRSRIKMVRGKFGDLEKGVFLDQYRQWGRMTEAAAVAGVTAGTVRDHMEKDQEFAEAVMEAEGEYKDKLLAHHQDLLFNGVEKEMYDRNGNIVSRETQYPIRLIEMELKKHDSGYREKQELEVKHKGGVLLAPAEVGSIEDWETRFNNAKNVTPDVEDKKIEDKNFEDAEVVED